MERRPLLRRRLRLLPGEDLNSTDLEDAGHWQRVYAELADLMGSLTCPSAGDTCANARARWLMTMEAERMRSRRDYWTSRRGSLIRVARGRPPSRRPLPAC
jgi:hypothetical protein